MQNAEGGKPGEGVLVVRVEGGDDDASFFPCLALLPVFFFAVWEKGPFQRTVAVAQGVVHLRSLEHRGDPFSQALESSPKHKALCPAVKMPVSRRVRYRSWTEARGTEIPVSPRQYLRDTAPRATRLELARVVWLDLLGRWKFEIADRKSVV